MPQSWHVSLQILWDGHPGPQGASPLVGVEGWRPHAVSTWEFPPAQREKWGAEASRAWYPLRTYKNCILLMVGFAWRLRSNLFAVTEECPLAQGRVLFCPGTWDLQMVGC